MACRKRLSYSMLIAYVYIFCYVNLQEVNPGPKMITFYVTMFLENSLLLAVWLALKENDNWFHFPAMGIVWGGFIAGCMFMALYYGCFHIRRLKNLLNDEQGSAAGGGPLTPAVQTETYIVENETDPAKNKLPQQHVIHGKKPNILSHSGQNGNHNGPYQNGVTNVVVPGVFNCRLNPALKRKKKKPSSFVPLPTPASDATQPVETHLLQQKPMPEPELKLKRDNEVIQEQLIRNMAGDLDVDEDDDDQQRHEIHLRPLPRLSKMSLPFWKKALPILSSKYSSSDHESSVGSRVNIQQKLQEKKQQQLQQLKEIEEEIKQGKLKRPCVGPVSASCLLGIPQGKKQPSMHTPVSIYEGIYQWPNCSKPRSQTPEILLAPHYLDDSRIYYDYQEPWGIPSYVPIRRRESDASSQSNYSGYGHITHSRHHLKQNPAVDLDPNNCDANIYKSYRIPSDLDSQISLPRSYTLPREFKFYRRQKPRKPICADHFAASNNSSDGDVDSVDDNVSPMVDEPHSRSRPYILHLRQGLPGQMHETKL